MPLNPSHIPRLVYDYLFQNGYEQVADLFAEKCAYLTGLKYSATLSGQNSNQIPPISGPSLSEIVEQHLLAREQSQSSSAGSSTKNAKGKTKRSNKSNQLILFWSFFLCGLLVYLK